MGLWAGIAGISSTIIHFTWWLTTGDFYRLPTFSAVFVIVELIQGDIVSAGLDRVYVQFFNGLIIIPALLGHRWDQIRYRCLDRFCA